VGPLGADEDTFFGIGFCAAFVVAAFLGGILRVTQFSNHLLLKGDLKHLLKFTSEVP